MLLIKGPNWSDADTEANRERLLAIQSVLSEHADRSYRVVFDANEQFPDMGAFARFVASLAESAPLRELWKRTLWFEQPVEREASLDSSVVADLREVSQHRPVILDESDGTVGTVCIYEASCPEAIRRHAAAADLPVDEIIAVADTVVVRPDPAGVGS